VKWSHGTTQVRSWDGGGKRRVELLGGTSMADSRSMRDAFWCSVRCAANAKRGTEMCRPRRRSTITRKQLACPGIVAAATRVQEAGACHSAWRRAIG
jgi:hypothetical protein